MLSAKRFSVAERVPTAAALAVLIAGVLFSERCDISFPNTFWCIFAALCLLSVLVRGPRLRAAAALTALFLLPVSVRLLREGTPAESRGRMFVQAVVCEQPVLRGRYHCSRAYVSCRASDDDASFRFAELCADTSLHLTRGDRITCTGYLRPPSAPHRVRGRKGGTLPTLLVEGCDAVAVVRGGSKSLHAYAVERLSLLDLSPRAAAVTAAMAAGERRNTDASLRRSYVRSGTAHILAVSGMHVGLVFVLANFLSRFLALLRHGTLVRCLFVIAVVWLYAAMCDLTPSVRRAAMMFSLLQLSRAASVKVHTANILAGTALLLTALEPRALFDVGFQLSFAAVAGIVLCMDILRDVLYRADRWSVAAGWLLRLAVVSLAAFVATAPVVSAVFGTLSLAGIIATPVVAVSCAAVMSLSVLWIVAPAWVPSSLFSLLLERIAEFQNDVVAAVASWPAACFDCRCPWWCAVLFYLAAALFAVSRTGTPRGIYRVRADGPIWR